MKKGHVTVAIAVGIAVAALVYYFNKKKTEVATTGVIPDVAPNTTASTSGGGAAPATPFTPATVVGGSVGAMVGNPTQIPALTILSNLTGGGAQLVAPPKLSSVPTHLIPSSNGPVLTPQTHIPSPPAPVLDAYSTIGMSATPKVINTSLVSVLGSTGGYNLPNSNIPGYNLPNSNMPVKPTH
jgi:hypothetical protein